MSETQEWPTFSAEDIDAAKMRDTRFAIIGRAIAIETDLRDNETIKALLGAARADADQAIEELSELSPTDINAVSLALVKIRTLVYIRRVLNIILQRGVVAERAIRAEDQVEQRDE